MSFKGKLFAAGTISVGLVILSACLISWESLPPLRFLWYLILSTVASAFKVRLPGVTGTMSVNFLFILLGIADLGLPETLCLGASSILFQCYWKAAKRPRAVQVLFNVGCISIAIAIGHGVYQLMRLLAPNMTVPSLLAITAAAYFLANTLPVAVVISLTEEKPLGRTWRECYFWSFPYYLVGAAIAGFLVNFRFVSWQSTSLLIPILYWIYRSYRLYLGRLEDEKKHAEAMAGLHLRTIEALAMAIEAKDHTTHDHTRRVEVYAVEIGKELGLTDVELEALRAASILHDIGKLAVPEHIICKPSRLTTAEFEKIKLHPIVGAEILEQVDFPYPVAPIVRAHHEKWDGSGYPTGLRGEQIPIGARILATVDCLDALSTDRQYRRALALDEAMVKVADEAGRSFDPRVVEVLQRRYRDLERMAQERLRSNSKLPASLVVRPDAAPAAGLEPAFGQASRGEDGRFDFLACIAAARQEAHDLLELTHDLGNSLSLHETLSVLGIRLKRMIPYDTIAVYVCHENRLTPEYVSGENIKMLAAFRIPLGAGLSGWVAENDRPIINGDPSVEPGYLNDPLKFSTLQSALSVPLKGTDGVAGVLTLYHGEREHFTSDHLRILQAISYKLAQAIENAISFRRVQDCATTDPLTGLPNARSLFLQLDRELARAKRQSTTLTVLVCDLDGFKQINDKFGHLEGNKVLRLLAHELRRICREYDYVARMGGDEFVIILPQVKPDAARVVASRAAMAAAETGRLFCGEDILSMSIGEAFYPQDGADAEQLLAEADRRMYKVKREHKACKAERTLSIDWALLPAVWEVDRHAQKQLSASSLH